jgi:hypothetical protein
VKDNVLVMACTTRFRRKYATVVLYKPIDWLLCVHIWRMLLMWHVLRVWRFKDSGEIRNCGSVQTYWLIELRTYMTHETCLMRFKDSEKIRNGGFVKAYWLIDMRMWRVRRFKA